MNSSRSGTLARLLKINADQLYRDGDLQLQTPVGEDQEDGECRIPMAANQRAPTKSLAQRVKLTQRHSCRDVDGGSKLQCTVTVAQSTV